jgi:hypothetical protein
MRMRIITICLEEPGRDAGDAHGRMSLRVPPWVVYVTRYEIHTANRHTQSHGYINASPYNFYAVKHSGPAREGRVMRLRALAYRLVFTG